MTLGKGQPRYGSDGCYSKKLKCLPRSCEPVTGATAKNSTYLTLRSSRGCHGEVYAKTIRLSAFIPSTHISRHLIHKSYYPTQTPCNCSGSAEQNYLEVEIEVDETMAAYLFDQAESVIESIEGMAHKYHATGMEHRTRSKQNFEAIRIWAPRPAAQPCQRRPHLFIASSAFTPWIVQPTRDKK